MKRRHFLTLGMWMAAALVLDACAGTRSRASGQPATTLKVENRAFLDMVIYLIVDGSRRTRLGTATGNTTTVLTIPATYIHGSAELQFVADPVGSPTRSISERIFVNPGDSVVMIIPPGTGS